MWSINVFKERDYRTPAMVYNRDSKTLLVFASGKMAGGSHRELVMRKADMVRESFLHFSPRWYKTETLREASFPELSSINPCPVFDEKNNKLFLFFVVTSVASYQQEHLLYNARLCYLTSDDFGRSWSEVTHLNTSLPEHCVSLAIGPGHGLQTEDGRLIVPAFAFMKKDPANKPVPHAVALYSDDGGDSWQLGSLLPEKSAASHMAEVWGDEGRFIYCNANMDLRMVEASSQDNGDTFVITEGGMFANTRSVTAGSLLSIPVQDSSLLSSDASPTNKWLILTQPDILGFDLRVYVNKTPSDPKGWSEPCIFNRGRRSGHSDMVHLGDGCIVCVYETSKHEDIEDVVMKIFNFKEIQPNTTDYTDTEYVTVECPCTIM